MSFVRSEEGDRPSISGPNPGIQEAITIRNSTFRPGAAAKKAKALLLEDANIRETLRRIVSGFSTDPIVQQDMLQECMICLWHAESKKPGRTTSWYLQNCRFHVQHWLVLGRSLDSPKRASGANRITIGGTDDEPALQEYHTNGEVLDTVCARDLVLTLARHLSPSERVVLGGLAEGMVLREVAYRLRLSYPTALKYRRKIAALTMKLGIGAPQARNKATTNGRSKSPATRKIR